MEIDFMGLYSQNPAPGPPPTGCVPDDSGIGCGDGNVSLSLCTSSPVEEKAVFQDFLWEKKRKSPAENMASIRNSDCSHDRRNAQPRERSSPTMVGKPVISCSDFRYNRNGVSKVSRKKSDRPLSFPASSSVFCPNAAPIFLPAQKADSKMCATGDASFDGTRKSKDVATARRATLARFLEKRSHRLNQQIKPHLLGRPLNWSGAGDTTYTKCDKKLKSSIQYEVLI